MNRSILIIICDFLLVSLLAFSTVDINKVANDTKDRRVKVEMTTNQADSRQDLGNVMRLALEEERKKRDQLVGELTKTRDSAAKQQAELAQNLARQQAELAQARDAAARQQAELAQTLAQTKDAAARQQAELVQTKDAAARQQAELAQTKDAAARQQAELAQAREATARREAELAQARDTAARQQSELARTREEAARQQALLAEREKALFDREKQLQGLQGELQKKETQTQMLQQQQAQLQQQQSEMERQRSALQQQFAAAQSSASNLNQQLQGASMESLISKERLAAIEAETRKQMDQAAALQQQLAQLAKSNQVMLTEKQQLAGQLQVAEAEKRMAFDQAARMRDEVKVEREEKAKLAEGVAALAAKSGELAQEIRVTRPLVPNSIFSELVTNRVQANISAFKPGLFGDSSKRKATQTVLVTDGTKIYALCHVQDTPLIFWERTMDLDGLTGTLNHDTSFCAIQSVCFHKTDPRLMFMPVTEKQAKDLGCKVYKVSADPYKFQDAVVVGAREGYYGECKFQMDLSTPDYVKMDHSSLKGLFGKFNPSSGDLVFSKSGELMGIMANSTYCLMLRNFDVAATFRFGEDLRDQRTGATLSMFYSAVLQMPFKLQ